MTESYKILINKLNQFRRKYYFFKLVKGLLFTLLISILAYLVISVIEYFAYLPSTARTFILYSGIVLIALLLIQFVLIPFFQLFHIIKQFSNENINKIIVKHFPDVKDKLLNVLQLSELEDKNYSSDIILASIDQKINEIKIFNFQKAISFKQLRFIAVYLVTTFIIIIGIIIFEKPLLTESNYRIINHKIKFSKPAPFSYKLLNKELIVNKGDEYKIMLECSGESVPQVVYVNIEGNNFLMKKINESQFEYNIESVINSFSFHFTDLKYISEQYYLKILPKPGVNDFSIKIWPPAYTMMSKNEVNNIGDLKIAAGTKLEWDIRCIDTDSVMIRFDDKESLYASNDGISFKLGKRILENSTYNIYVKNEFIDYSEVLSYTLTVIPDLFPEIKVVQSRDSLLYTRFYFKGEIADDYGFSELNFHLNYNNTDSIYPLQVVKNLVNQEFYYTIDFSQLNIDAEEISYYFSVSDNDKINGAKTTTSGSFVYKVPSQEDIIEYDKQEFAEIEDMAIESQQLVKEIKEGLKELQFKNLDSKVSGWEKSQIVNDIVNKKNLLEKLTDQIDKHNQDLNNFLNSFEEKDNEILEKQKQIEELLDEVFSDELKELMEEFQKLAEEFNEKKFNKLSEKMDLSMDDLSEQLSRNLEMLRKMKVEQKLQDIVDFVNKLANDEEKLADEINEKKNYEEVLEKDNEQKSKLNDIEKELNDVLELNEKLEKPLQFDDFKEEINSINESFELNKENLQKRKKKKSSESIKNTSEEIQNLAFNMDQLLQANMMQMQMENIENLRQILSNLINFSFSQEDLIEEFKSIDLNDPLLSSLKRRQKKLQDQSAVIKDSLYALAGRSPEVGSIVNKELLVISNQLSKIAGNLDEGHIPQSLVSQQYVLTSTNNLAVFLNEVLEQLEEQAANGMGGCQNCENPSNKPGGKSMSKMKQSAEGIKQQLQKMIEEMKKGNSQGMSKMLGESLMQHEMMQQMLREFMNNGSVGSSGREQLQNIDRMLEETRKEIMNKNITQKTLFRQNQIMTRLLEAEKSEIERDIDNKRESETANKDFYSNPVKYFEYKNNTESGIENLEQNIFKLNNFYNKKYKKYINSIDEQNAK